MISEAIKIALVVSTAPTIAALAAWYKIRCVHKELNSRLTEWKQETKDAAIAAAIAAYDKGAKDQKTKDQQP